jgi:hypothetical protein
MVVQQSDSGGGQLLQVLFHDVGQLGRHVALDRG